MLEFLRYYRAITRKDLLDKLNVEMVSTIPRFESIKIFNNCLSPVKNDVKSMSFDMVVFDRFLFLEHIIKRRVSLHKHYALSLGYAFVLRKFEIFEFLTSLFLYFETTSVSPLYVNTDLINGNYSTMLTQFNRFCIFPDEHFNVRNDLSITSCTNKSTYSFQLLVPGLRLGKFFILS